MNHTRLLIVAAMAVAALALVAAATIASPLQLAEAHKQKNNGCRDAICIGVNGNQDSANNNDNSFNFSVS
jgi:Spy/CpxP family protein refolding chaperone